MAELNIEKMKEILKSKKITYDELSIKTGISKSSISKIFGGFNENPTMKFLKTIATALDCSIDDFFDWETVPTSPQYVSKQTAKIAQRIQNNPNYLILLDAMNDFTPDQLDAIISVANAFSSCNKKVDKINL